MYHTSSDLREGGRPTRAVANEPIYAALDLGTNNCRLLIASADTGNADALRVYDSFSRIVRLGEGVSSSGELSKEAMDRTMAALRACQKKIHKHQVAGMRCVATEACRRASNAEEFMQRIREEVGLSIDIISTEEEARLAFLGCSSLLMDNTRQAIVFDIGGGSTELMWIDVSDNQHSITDWMSIGYGVMNLADKFGGSEFADMAFGDMVELLTAQLAPFEQRNAIRERLGDKSVQLLSTSGTVTTLAAIHLDLPRYDRARIDGLTLSVEDIRITTRRLLEMRPSERFHHPCIGADRSDFILSGCAIFEAISTLWPAANITIADRGVREGIILSLMAKA